MGILHDGATWVLGYAGTSLTLAKTLFAGALMGRLGITQLVVASSCPLLFGWVQSMALITYFSSLRTYLFAVILVRVLSSLAF